MRGRHHIIKRLQITHEIRLTHWKEIVEACNNRPAGLSARAWLEENGIKVKTYYYWLRRIRREAYEQIKSDNKSGLTLSTNRNVSYADITLTGNTSSGPAMHPVAVISSGNLSIDISDNASEEFLMKLMRAMKYVG